MGIDRIGESAGASGAVGDASSGDRDTDADGDRGGCAKAPRDGAEGTRIDSRTDGGRGGGMT